MTRVIENVQTIGVYYDEIRIVPAGKGKAEDFSRKNHKLSIRGIERIDDEMVAHERRIAIHLKPGAVCKIDHDSISCTAEE
jgi:hypothetical protein